MANPAKLNTGLFVCKISLPGFVAHGPDQLVSCVPGSFGFAFHLGLLADQMNRKSVKVQILELGPKALTSN